MNSTTAGKNANTSITAQSAAIPILISLSFCHLLNDLIQSLIPALYPLFKEEYGLDFAQIGIITLAFQMTASLLQPTVGFYTDKKPQPFSLAFGMCSTLIGSKRSTIHSVTPRATSYCSPLPSAFGNALEGEIPSRGWEETNSRSCSDVRHQAFVRLQLPSELSRLLNVRLT